MQVQQEMDALIANELEEGERVLWIGRPHPSSRSSASPAFVFLILAAIFGLVGILGLLIGFIILSAVPGRAGSGGSLGLFIVGGTFILMALIFGLVGAFYRQNLKGTLYAITDQRIISVTTGNNLVVYSYGKQDIGIISRIERSDGTGDLIFSQSRLASPYGYYGGYGYYSGYSTYGASSMGGYGAAATAGKFIGISNVREVERIVRHTFK